MFAYPRSTLGHQSLRIRLASGDVVLAADACYFCRTLRERRLPQRFHDREAMLASLDKLARLEAAGARIFFGHDGKFWKLAQSANGHHLGPVAKSIRNRARQNSCRPNRDSGANGTKPF